MKKKTKPNSGPVDTLEPGANVLQHLTPMPAPPLTPPELITEDIFFSSVGHTFKAVPPQVPGPRYCVQDFLIDQTGSSGTDGKMRSFKPFDLTTTVTYYFNVFPKNRKKRIKVTVPAGLSGIFHIHLGRRFVNAASDVMDTYPALSLFDGISGAAPAFTENVFLIGHNTNHWITLKVAADIVESFDFNGFRARGTYSQRSFDPGTKSYIPFSSSVPFNLTSLNGVPHLMFSYRTDNPVDPGPFVFLS